MVFSRAVLFVEDESQKNVLLGFAKTLDYELDKYCVSIISCDGHDGYKPYLPLVKALQIPYIFLRDKPWGQSEDKKIFRSFGCELEDFLKKNDFSSLLKEAQKEVGDSKQRMARYIGEKASKDQIPQFFSDLLEDILKLSNKKK